MSQISEARRGGRAAGSAAAYSSMASLDVSFRVPNAPEERGFDARCWSRADTTILALVIALSAAVTIALIRWHSLPAEDALMLLRYARHLRDGQGITWNVGERPVEGATDFLFLMMVTGWMKLTHLAPIVAGRSLLALAHVASVAWLYVASRRVFGTHPVIAAALSMYLATGPGLLHASNDFSPPAYGLLAMIAWTFACATVVEGESTGRTAGFAGFAILMGLMRPDGVLLAMFMTVALLFALRGRSKRIVLTTLGVFAIVGGAYFMWRMHYFGDLLPNPFYKKNGGHLHRESLRLSLSAIFKMLLPAWPVFLAGLMVPRVRRPTVFALIPIALFGVIWVLLTPENDVNMRFQYVALPVGLISVPMVLSGLWEQAKRNGWLGARALRLAQVPMSWIGVSALALAVMIGTAPFDFAWWKALYSPDPVGSGNYDIASGLAPLAGKHYTMAVTEAGVIPYFSGWRTIDTWGLNDRAVAHDPQGLTEAYLDANQPAIIMLHLSPIVTEGQAGFEQVWRGEAATKQDISQLEQVQAHYALTHGYELAARWGVTPCVVHVWYVRRDLPESAQMVELIRKSPHFFSYGGQLATNFMGAEPPSGCYDRLSLGWKN